MIFITAGIIISGGYGGDSAGSSGSLSSVELIREDGSSCNLPPLPTATYGHSLSGLVACGGQHTKRTCSTFSDGSWDNSHTLREERFYHVSWSSHPNGVLLLGGYSNNVKRSTELLSKTSSTTTSQFTLSYDAR